METYQFIATILSIVISAITVAGIISKALNKTLKNKTEQTVTRIAEDYTHRYDDKLEKLSKELQSLKNDQDDTNKLIKHNLLSMTRCRINETYKELQESDTIDQHQAYILEELYKSYKALGGNSFVDREMDEIRTKKII